MRQLYNKILILMTDEINKYEEEVEKYWRNALDNKESHALELFPYGFKRPKRFTLNQDSIKSNILGLKERWNKRGYNNIEEFDESIEYDNVILTIDLNLDHSCNKFMHFSTGLLDREWRFGVADNIAQIKKEYGDEGIIIAVIMEREDPEDGIHSGGFRPHKWGDYIGDHEQVEEFEYLSETDVPYVLLYKVYQIREGKDQEVKDLIKEYDEKNKEN